MPVAANWARHIAIRKRLPRPPPAMVSLTSWPWSSSNSLSRWVAVGCCAAVAAVVSAGAAATVTAAAALYSMLIVLLFFVVIFTVFSAENPLRMFAV